MKQYPFAVSAVCLVLLVTSCQSHTGDPQTERFTGEYAAHVQLDSTILIATEIINGLEAPRDITLGPDGWIWYNEIRGSLFRVNPESGEVMKVLEVPDVFFQRARGLLSTAIHPDFENHPYVYLNYTFDGQELGSRLTRYTFTGDTLTNRKVLLDSLPGGYGHSGSKMMIGPDNKLWLAAGDAHRGDLAQDLSTYHGKVLRMNLDGSVPDDNPIEGSRLWTSGHRNIQGITHGRGKIYISEHGPANDDEVNLLQKRGNYGWPDVMGFCDSESEIQYCRDSLIVEPIVAFNPVVAPAGIEYYDHDAIPEWKNSLLLTSLRIQTLRVLHLSDDGEQVDDIQIFFQQHFGRIRDVAVDPEGRIFLLTSNTDWYRESRPEIHDPSLVENGDRIIMLQRADESLLARFEQVENKLVLREDRVALYLGDSEIADDMEASQKLFVTHCGSCHRPDGSGMPGFAPALIQNERVAGSRNELISIMLNGMPAEEQTGRYEFDMPAYRNLNNDEIAAILNYVRGEFSSETDNFRPDDIKEIRDYAD